MSFDFDRGGEVLVADLAAARLAGIDAYELVEQLPRGTARSAAWNAYVFETYGDKLIAAGAQKDRVGSQTAQLAFDLFSQAAWWVERAQQLGAGGTSPPDSDSTSAGLPHFQTPIRSQEQLVGMRETLTALRAFVAYDLRSLNLSDATGESLRALLAAVDQQMATVDMLWIPEPPPEFRAGIGDALASGLEKTYALGQQLAGISIATNRNPS